MIGFAVALAVANYSGPYSYSSGPDTAAVVVVAAAVDVTEAVTGAVYCSDPVVVVMFRHSVHSVRKVLVASVVEPEALMKV